MGFNSAFKGLKLFKKTPGNGRLSNLNDPSRPQCVKVKIRLNGEVVGLTGLSKTQSMIGLLCVVFKVVSCSS